MKKTQIWAAVCCMVLVMGLAACTGKEQPVLHYRFASQEEGQRLRLANTAYFSYLIESGFFGCYDLGLEDRKVKFIPYSTPELIRNMHNTLLEYYPGGLGE